MEDFLKKEQWFQRQERLVQLTKICFRDEIRKKLCDHLIDKFSNRLTWFSKNENSSLFKSSTCYKLFLLVKSLFENIFAKHAHVFAQLGNEEKKAWKYNERNEMK